MRSLSRKGWRSRLRNMLAAVREGAKLSEEFVLREFISPQRIRVAGGERSS